jgi:transposase
MSKIRQEEKIKAIKEIEAGESIIRIGRRLKIDKTELKWIVSCYREHGENGLSCHAYNWTAEQRYEVLKYMNENQLSFRETGVRFGIRHSTILQWERRYLENGISGLEDKKKGRKPRTPKLKLPMTRLEELEEENLYLRIENEYLKKLNALVAEREKRERENK